MDHPNPALDGSDNGLNNEFEEDDIYEDDSEEPAILHSAHETDEEGDNQHNPIPEPDRLQRQPPSRQGRVAYVLYGGRGSEPGVYYNWASCMAVIRRYYHNSAPPYMGFNNEEHARVSFAAFQTSRQLPAGLFPPTSLRPLSDSPVPSSQSPLPLTPRPRGTTPTSPFSRTAVNPPRTPIRPALPMRNSFGFTRYSPHRDPSSPIPNPLSTERRNIAPTSVVTPRFYLVIEGDAPGVYGSQMAALQARGLHGSRVTIYTTRETANQAFVDAYMASRVSALPA